jgi:hypothetical protein
LFTDKSDPEYLARRDAICALYTRELPDDEVVVCLDEKTGVQALGLPPGLPHGGRRAAARGRPELVDHHYVRHGSRTLVAAVRPDTGKLVTAEVFPARGYDSHDTVAMLQSILSVLPDMRRIHLIWDNGPTHRSTRTQEFLASPEAQQFAVLYTPCHASWLNLAENFLSRFSRRYLRHRRHASLDAFDEHLYACIEDYANWARGMSWSYNPANA